LTIQTVKWQVSSKNFLQCDAESCVSRNQVKCYENMKQDRPDLSYDNLVRLTDIFNVTSP
jgi:hypothetical protein